jgi:hypothetical protein
MSAGTIMKKIQTLEDTIESLRQQLVFTRTEEDNENKQPMKQPTKQTKEKMPAAAAAAKQKKMKESKEEEKDKIPMPWIGQVDFDTCVGLKAQYGLFIQCGKASDMSTASFQIDNHECRFCADCSRKCDEDGKHAVGTIEERIEAGVGKYVNAKTGKKETMYIEVLEKMGITKEQALESAAKRGFQIPDWMLEKAEKKRGRPSAAASATSVVADKVNTGDETKDETKEKKPRQPRAKSTTSAKTTTKKTAKASVVTSDTPQKKNSDQSSICIDLNDQNDDGDVTPVAAADVVATPVPEQKDKKKRGRPTKSNAQSNVGESEMQKLITQATTEKKKRLSLDPVDTHTSSEDGNHIQVETQLIFEDNKQEQLDDDEIFEMFDMLFEENMKKEQQQQQQPKQQEQEVVAATVVEPVITVTANEKKEKTKKAKNSNEKSEKTDKTDKKNDDKVSKKEAAAAKKKAEEEAAAAAKKKAEEEAAAAAKKKAEEEAAAAAKKKAEEEKDEETEDEAEEQENNDEEEEELECEEYEYDGETYGLAPNGDIYSQDGDLVGKLTNGVPKMFN